MRKRIWLLLLTTMLPLLCVMPQSVSGAVQFTTLSLTTITNGPLDWLYAAKPAGSVTYQSVPFQFASSSPQVFVTQNTFGSSLATSASLVVNIARPTVLNLLVAANATGNAAYQGAEIGRVRLTFADATEYVAVLKAGTHLRPETWLYDGVNQTTPPGDSSITVTNVITEIQNRSGAAKAFLDMLTINLPAAAANTSLTGIYFTDTSTTTVGNLAPGFIIAAATVGSDTAVSGDLDPLNLNIAGSYVMATAVQPDGKTIVSGSFTSVLGVPRSNIARLNADGTLDTGFDPKANGEVASVAVQADGKILLGGVFTSLQPNGAAVATTRNRVARLNADGSLDTGFDPNASSAVRSLALQMDGKILLGGGFTSLQPNGAVSATGRSRIARINADGTLDASFDLKANGEVASVAVQADGRILFGGSFTTLQPNGAASATSRKRIARVYADGTLETGFDPAASNTVNSVAVQADGRILIGGTFTSLQPNGAASPTLRNCIARVSTDGTLDMGFDPKASNAVNSMAVQADGKILLGGSFTTLQPNGAASATTRNRIARVNADGTLDTGFDPKADNVVYSMAVQADGRILIGGFFTSLQPNGAASATARNKIARLYNDTATQTLSAVDATQVNWARGGSIPEVSQVTLEKSTDSGATWTLLGNASRVGTTSNWLLNGLRLPASGQLRARGRTTHGYQNGGSGLIEQVAGFSGLVTSANVINGSTLGHALWNRPNANGSGVPNNLSGTTTPYEAVAFSVTASGSYTLTTTATNPNDWDTYLLLYSTAFNPATPLANVLIGDDDSSAGLNSQISYALQAGTLYFAVTTGYRSSSTGDYSLNLQGPGSFSERPILTVEQPAGSGIASGGSVYFDNVPVSSTNSKTLALKNLGDGALTVLSVTLEGADAAQFNLPSPPVNQVINPNGSFDLAVEFKPTSAGRKTATLHINSNDPLHLSYDILLSGNGLPDMVIEQPVGVALSPGVSSLNFGALTTGGTSTLSFTVRNAGSAPLSGLAASVTGAAAGDFTLSPLGATTLLPAASTTFNVSFSPGALGARAATLHIAGSDATKNPFDVSLSGIGSATSEFASTTVGRPSWNRPNANGNAAPVALSGVVAPYDTIGFTVTNSGTYTLTSTATNPTGWDTYLFLYSTAFDATAPLNQVLIGDDDDAGNYNSQFSYTLQTGITYYAVVTAYGTNQAGDYALKISGPGNVNVVPNMALIDQLGVGIPDGGNSYMPSVAVGGSTSSTYTIRNYGYTDLTGLGMTLDGADAGAFSITTQPTAPVTGPNGSTTFVITFSPSSAGTKRAALHITSNDPNKTPFDILLTGNGTPAIAVEQPVGVRLTDAASTVPYGSVLLGSSKLLTFTIRSQGTAALSVIGSSVDGANAADFTVQNLTPGLLVPGMSSTFRVLFAPSATGARSATLHLTSNDPLAASFDIALSGTGTPRTPAIDVGLFNYGYGLTSGVSTVSFGSPPLSTSTVRTFFIRNYGTADLTGLSASTSGTHAADFTVGSLSSSPLAPYDGRILEITFTPSAAGLRTAVLHIISNDPLHGSFDINLVGNNSDWFSDLPRTTIGCPTWNRPDANGTGVPGALSPGATATPFDIVSFTVSTTGDYTFKCTGTTPIDWNVYLMLYRDAFDPANPLQNVVIGDDDSAGGHAAGFTITLQAGSRYFIVISGADNAAYGLYSLQVSGPDSAMLEPYMLIEQPTNRGFLSGGSSYFGPAAIGESVSNSFTIRNVGYANLTGLNLTLEGRDADQFSITQDPLSTITGPSGTANFTVSFTPGSLGQKSVLLHIASNDPNSNPFDINLIGNAPVGSADLTGLTTTAGVLAPFFAGTTTGYSTTVSGSITSTTLTATRANATLQIRVNGGSYSALTSGIPSGALALNVGTNIIEIRVTSQDGLSIKTYTLTITRAVPVLAAGDLDPLNPALVGNLVNATAVQPDGKIIIVGSFTSILGQSRNNIARLNADGTLDSGFNPNVTGIVNCVAVQADGKILLGGQFTSVGGTTRNRIARIATGGTLDSGFNPNANNPVYSVVVQADGQILIGGDFTTVSGTARNRIARLVAGGSLDAGFNPNVNSSVLSLAVQANGKILIGGSFTTVSGTGRNRIARVDTTGTLDAGFNPNANNPVNSVAMQADGRILLGGSFTSMGGIARSNMARVDDTGALDSSFNPNVSSLVTSIALQADGRILLGGSFTTVSGVGRNRIARLAAAGTLDLDFNPDANNTVNSVAEQEDGKILLGGLFTTIGGTARNRFARLLNDPATQTLSVPTLTQVIWSRGGSSPELSQVTFEQSVDNGANWTPLGNGSRVDTSSSWQLTGLSLPYGGQIRARGRSSSGYQNGSSGLVESVAGFSFPPTVTAISPNRGSTFGGTGVTISGTNFSGVSSVTIGGIAATSVAVTSGTTITALTPANVAGVASVLVTNPGGTNAANMLFTYFVPSNNADLSALSLTTAKINEPFSSNSLAYTSSVPYTTNSITVTPTADQANATIQARVGINAFALVTSGTPSAGLALAVGPNIIEIQVTAQDGMTIKTYTITVTRAPGPVLAIIGNSLGIISGDNTPGVADNTYFGSVAIASGTRTHAFTISNMGVDAMNLTGAPKVRISGAHAADFNVSIEPASPVAVSSSTTFQITFDPGAMGLRTAMVSIDSDDLERTPYTFAISGIGRITGQIAQTLVFTPPLKLYLAETRFTLSASTNSGLPVVFSVVSGPASVLGNVLTLTGTGAVKVRASQPGDVDFLAATPVERTITVAPNPPSPTLANLSQIYTGTPRPITVLGAVGTVEVMYQVGPYTTPTPPINAGSYVVEVVAGGLARRGTLVITKAPLFVIPEDQRKFAGQANPALGFGYSGFLGSDNATNSVSKAPAITTTAAIASAGGIYPITASGGTSANYLFVYQKGTMKVETFAASYEALLMDAGTQRPAAKLELTVAASSKTFTAKLTTPTETAAVAFNGTLGTPALNETVTGTANVKKGANTYLMNVTLPLTGDFAAEVKLNDVTLGTASNGRKLLTLTTGQSLSYTGTHSALLAPAISGAGVPAGAGWAAATIDAKGMLKLAGKLADGAGLTASLAADVSSNPGYRLFLQPYTPARTGAFIAGAFALKPHPDLTGRRSVSFADAADLTWVKAPHLLDTSYRAGFGPLNTRFTLDPWMPPVPAKVGVPAITLTQLLSLAADRFTAQYSTINSPSFADLPTTLGLNATTNIVSVIAPVTTPLNTTKWKVTVTPATGAFVGSFELTDAGKKRLVPFAGIMRQPSSTDTSGLIGDGNFLLPSLLSAPNNEILSGEIGFER